MTGIIRYGSRFGCREVRLSELPFFLVTLPVSRGKLWTGLYAGRAAQLMARRGIGECSFPSGFLQEELFRRKGIRPVDRLPLLWEKAGQWVLAERQAGGLCGSVGLAAERMTADTERAVEVLLKKVERVDLKLMPGAEVLQRRLRRESGASLRLVTAEQLARCETLLDFGKCDAVGQKLTLRLAESGKGPQFLLPEKLRKELPSWAEEDDFCVLLRRSGRIGANEIGVKSRK